MSSSPKASYEAWKNWMEEVPADERATVADFIRSIDLSQPDGVVKLNQEMMAMVAEGRLPPIVSSELRAWVMIVHEQLVAIHLASGQHAKSDTNILRQFNILVENRADVLDLEGVIEAAPLRVPARVR